MAEKTLIEWTWRTLPDGTRVPGATYNPWRGCTKVSPGCKNCYADATSGRNPAVLGKWGPKGTRVIAAEAMWREPEKWNREAEAAGQKRLVFCASLADVFEGRDTMPADAWEPVQAARQRLFAMALKTKWLTWLFLTKRPENIPAILSDIRHPAYPHTDLWTLQQRQPRPNWWFGTSVEDQKSADERIPHLLKVPTPVRFLSCEPLLGPVNITHIDAEMAGHKGMYCVNALTGKQTDMGRPCVDVGHIDWVIGGGESGPNARPCHPDWARQLRDECEMADVPFFWKQWGEYAPITRDSPMPLQRAHTLIGLRPDGTRSELLSADVTCMWRAGKKAAGRMLDGRVWDEQPTVEG